MLVVVVVALWNVPDIWKVWARTIYLTNPTPCHENCVTISSINFHPWGPNHTPRGQPGGGLDQCGEKATRHKSKCENLVTLQTEPVLNYGFNSLGLRPLAPMTNIIGGNAVDGILGDVAGLIGGALEESDDEQDVEVIRNAGGVLFHPFGECMDSLRV